MNAIIVRIAIALLTVLMISCDFGIEPSQIPGIYKANFPANSVYIIIFKNGTYKMQDSLDQKVGVKTATWKLKGNTIDFEMNSGGIWPAKIENENGMFRIVYASDSEDYFNKIKSF